jgi:hypothetical protein
VSATATPVVRSAEERLKALEESIAALSARSEQEGRNAQFDAILTQLKRTQHTDRRERKEAGYYPLWKPLDFDELAGTYSWQGFAERMSAEARKQISALSAELAKAIDTIGTGPLIRQDLDPTVYELFVKKFPLWDMIQKIPSNGEVHAYNTATGYGDAQFITESGSVTDDQTTYARQYANIAVLATRRGITLKALNSVRAGGVAYDPETREIEGGIRALTHRAQCAMFRYQDVVSGSTTTTDPNGIYNANAFNGLRWFLQNVSPAGNTISIDTTSGGGYTTASQAVSTGVRKAANAVIDQGGAPTALLCSVSFREAIVEEMVPLMRITNNDIEVIPGMRVPKIVAGDSELPIIAVPGDSIGTIVTGGHTYQDGYVVDMDQLAWAYLGGPGPTVLEIPVGVDGTLRKLYIPYMMGGLVQFAALFESRVQIKTA